MNDKRLSFFICEQQDGRGDNIGDADVEPPSRGAREAQEDLGEVKTALNKTNVYSWCGLDRIHASAICCRASHPNICQISLQKCVRAPTSFCTGWSRVRTLSPKHVRVLVCSVGQQYHTLDISPRLSIDRAMPLPLPCFAARNACDRHGVVIKSHPPPLLPVFRRACQDEYEG